MLLALAGAGGAYTQEPDTPVLALPPMEAGGARAIGLSGALVGLADDADTTAANPAGLVHFPRGFDTTAGLGDTPGVFSGFSLRVHPWHRFALGLGWRRAAFEIPRGALPGASRDLRARLDQSPSLSLAWRPRGPVSFGVAAQHAGLRLAAPGAPDVAFPARWTWSAGTLLRPRPDTRLGFAYQHDTGWQGRDAPPSANVHPRTPRVFSAGVSWAYDFAADRGQRLMVSGQVDLLRYRLPGDARAEEAEWRMGAEYSQPFNCYSGCGSMWQVRAGVHSAAVPGAVPRTLTGERHLHLALGASVAWQSLLRGRLKLDAALSLREGEPARFFFGLAFRYPEALRGTVAGPRRRPVSRPAEDES